VAAGGEEGRPTTTGVEEMVRVRHRGKVMIYGRREDGLADGLCGPEMGRGGQNFVCHEPPMAPSWLSAKSSSGSQQRHFESN
jgi:hypothetical protein